MKATETAVTLLSTTPTVEKGNGCFNEPPRTANNYDKEEATVSKFNTINFPGVRRRMKV